MDCMQGVVPSSFSLRNSLYTTKSIMSWKATFSILNKHSHILRQSVCSTLLMWALFCQRLKAESKRKFFKNPLMMFLYIIIFKQDKN